MRLTSLTANVCMAQNLNPDYNAVVNNESKSTNVQPSSCKDSHSVTKRLQKELLVLMTCGDKGISAFPDGDNLFKWIGTIHGAGGTVYEGFEYKLCLEFPSGYPYIPPVVKFQTPCFHPNVDEQGFICLDILKEKWSALYDVRTVLLSIQSLLAEPNNDSPLNNDAAELWSNPLAFKKILVQRHKQYLESKA